ncbi:hypothetical protein [Brevundimonas sp.]|uniref:hypothetical protein n=1 Tax=Brevundimonas sp. TaxID=1871086 RepID=UPI003D6CF82C
MSIKTEVDRAIHGYHGDDLQGVTVGFELWDDFCREVGLAPQPTEFGEGDVEVIYLGLSVRPGMNPDTINLLTGL